MKTGFVLALFLVSMSAYSQQDLSCAKGSITSFNNTFTCPADHNGSVRTGMTTTFSCKAASGQPRFLSKVCNDSTGGFLAKIGGESEEVTNKHDDPCGYKCGSGEIKVAH